MSSQHTPGPWKVEPYTRFDKGITILEPKCFVDNDDVDHEEATANARLIAAAPKMLATLKAFDAGFRDYEKLKAVIAEAEGK